MTTTIPESARLLTHRQVCELLQLSDRTVRTMVSAGKIPRPIKMGTQQQSTLRYDRGEIESWIRDLKENR